MFHEQPPWPKEVNEAPIAGKLSDRLLESGDCAPADSEYVEKLIPEGLAFRGLTGHASPVPAKGDGAVADLVP